MPTTYEIDTAFVTQSTAYTGAGQGSAGSTATWSSINSQAYSTSPNNQVFDNNMDGDLDIGGGDYWSSSSFPFSGYSVNINGTDYPMFEVAGGSFLAILRPVGETWTAADIPSSSNAYSGGNYDMSTFCFLAGTGIATATGEVNVEDCLPGDLIQTAKGDLVAIKWIGRQTLNKWRHGPHLQPVRIRAGALGDDLPHSDLTVTADHGMVIDGYVINASALVNRDSINFVPMGELEDSFTVYHIETEAHDVILANGAASETFLDVAGRAAFDNHQEYLDLYGVERIIPEMRNDRIIAQRLLPEAIKTRLGIADARVDCDQVWTF